MEYSDLENYNYSDTHSNTQFDSNIYNINKINEEKIEEKIIVKPKSIKDNNNIDLELELDLELNSTSTNINNKIFVKQSNDKKSDEFSVNLDNEFNMDNFEIIQ